MFAHETFFVTTATAFLCAYLSSWLELGMAFIDIQFNRIYETLYPSADATDTSATTDDAADADSALPHLSENKK